MTSCRSEFVDRQLYSGDRRPCGAIWSRQRLRAISANLNFVLPRLCARERGQPQLAQRNAFRLGLC
ncbi:MAG: hypothetical protein P8169_15140, partial [Chloroflexota bacterium]